ncbi:DUF3391 domain-containing protein, partial [Novosphingobium sp. 1949]
MALKRISPSQVETGMYIHAFHGNWFSHPFWRAHFVVEDESRCATLRESDLDALVIDTDKGKDVSGEKPPAPPSPTGQVPIRTRHFGMPAGGLPSAPAAAPAPVA